MQETQGVFVATYGETNDFPAFYTNVSNCKAPYSVANAERAAEIIKCHRELNLQSGMLFAVPVPQQHSIAADVINDVIENALEQAKRMGIAGKDVTPFLLQHIKEATGGKSLETS